MKKLVFLKNDTPLTTSLIIAEGTEIEHRSIIRLIQTYEKQFKRWGKVRFVDVDLKSATNFIEDGASDNHRLSNDGRGKPTKVALLNEPQATFLITLLRNNEIVVAFKGELVAQFFDMRDAIQKLGAEEVQRLQIRRNGIDFGRLPVTDAIQRFNVRDFKDGDKDPRARQRYARFTHETQVKALGIPAGGRDAADGATLAALMLAEKNSAAILNRTLETGGSWRQAQDTSIELFQHLKSLADGQYTRLQLKEHSSATPSTKIQLKGA